MPPFVLSLLASPKAWGALGVSLLLAFAGVQTWRIDHCKVDLAAARAAQIDPATRQTWKAEALADVQNLATARQNEAQANAALATSEAAVAALRAQGASDTAKAQAAVQAAQTRSAEASAAAAKALAMKEGADGCKSADQVIIDSLGGQL